MCSNLCVQKNGFFSFHSEISPSVDVTGCITLCLHSNSRHAHWLCLTNERHKRLQSNMAFGLGQDIDATTACAAADALPLLRLLVFTSGGATWEVGSKATACTGRGFAPFSAVCWYFGNATFHSLGGDVPIGLVYSAVGGTAVERWSGPDALAKCNQTGVVQQSNLWTPYIVPLLPMRVSGWLWYQAESNVACSVSWKWMPGLNCGIGCTEAQPVCNASIDGCASFYACSCHPFPCASHSLHVRAPLFSCAWGLIIFMQHHLSYSPLFFAFFSRATNQSFRHNLCSLFLCRPVPGHDYGLEGQVEWGRTIHRREDSGTTPVLVCRTCAVHRGSG